MRSPHRPLTPDSAQHATRMASVRARDWLFKAHAYEVDESREQRLKAVLCRTCYYLYDDRIGGQAMTTWYCGVCAKEQLAGSTAHDRVCGECAQAHQLCKQCGGDVHMRTARREWPVSITSTDS